MSALSAPLPKAELADLPQGTEIHICRMFNPWQGAWQKQSNLSMERSVDGTLEERRGWLKEEKEMFV
jgi:hypothetical protein